MTTTREKEKNLTFVIRTNWSEQTN